ncbi:MAG: hypothetical protein GY821_09915 [Gammaproteobacteria bacterium]|nr:hypothetical protein [Gammaproteobacteria bacterium]
MERIHNGNHNTLPLNSENKAQHRKIIHLIEDYDQVMGEFSEFFDHLDGLVAEQESPQNNNAVAFVPN